MSGTRVVDKKATHLARVKHGIGVARLNELFAYDPSLLWMSHLPRHKRATAAARKRRQIVRASRRANR